MKTSLLLSAAFCSMIITCPAQAVSSKTDLSKVGKTVNNVNHLMKTAIAGKTRPSKLKLPEITTSYVLGQGLTVTVAPIQFPEHFISVSDSTMVEQNAEQTQATQLAATKRAAYLRKARDLAHSAHHLREQGKSLRRSIEQADEQERVKLDKKLKEVREQMNAIEVERKMHARAAELTQFGDSGRQMGIENTTDLQQWYAELTHSVSKALCRQGNSLAALDDNEQVAVVYHLGKAAKGLKVKGWIAQKGALQSCAKGNISHHTLAKHVTEYQY